MDRRPQKLSLPDEFFLIQPQRNVKGFLFGGYLAQNSWAVLAGVSSLVGIG